MEQTDSKILPLDSFQKLLRAIYGQGQVEGYSLGFPTLSKDYSPGTFDQARGPFGGVLDELTAEVAEDTGELLRGDYSRQRLREWMEDTAAQVEAAREAGLSDATPEHVIESVLHDDETPEAVYGRRLVLAALRGVSEGKRYDAGFDSWLRA